MALIKCNECGHMVSDKALMCPNCGCPIPQEKRNICEECGEQIPDNATVCSNCGCPNGNVEVVHEDIYEEEPSRKKWWIWALAVSLLCLLGGGGYYAYTKYFNGESNKDAIVELTPEFIKAIEKYDQLCIFSEGYAAVKKDKKWGYINTKGQEIIPTLLNAYCVGRFSEGLAFVVMANEKEEKDFSIIDTNGNIIFQGKCNYGDDDSPQNEEMPYFIDGKIYIPTLNESWEYQVYDKKGALLDVVNYEEIDSIYRQHENSKYIIFVDDSTDIYGGDEIRQRKCGIKDSAGIVLISPKYNEIGGKCFVVGEEDYYIAYVSNGVALVVLEELDKNTYVDGPDAKPNKRHYGYADLKGNDTFSEALKERCRKSELLAMNNYKHYLNEENMNSDKYDEGDDDDWLQGTWTTKVNIMGQTKVAKLVIDGNYITFYSDGEVLDKGEYEIDDGQINFGSTYFYIDEGRQLIKFDDNHYFNHSSQPTTSVNVGTPEQEKELKIMTRLKELGKKGQDLVLELSAMRQRGQMDPARYLYIKQTLIQYKDEQIRLSQELGDAQMAREYMQQKDGVLQSFRMIENGY